MAVVWEKRAHGRHYEVRMAGQSRRLYTDGVFHSQFNPRQPVSGNVWDLLFLPAFFYPPGEIRRVLLLGVGGGAVLRQLRHFVAPEFMVGVELNNVHLQVARRFFHVSGADVQLHCADAVEWLQAYEGPAFDMIIDDLFGEQEGEPVRAVAMTASWMKRLGRHLHPKGQLVVNFPSSAALRACAYFQRAAIQRSYAAAFQLSTPQNENAIGVFLRHAADRAQLRRHLQAVPALDGRRKTCRLRYRLQRL